MLQSVPLSDSEGHKASPRSGGVRSAESRGDGSQADLTMNGDNFTHHDYSAQQLCSWYS
jgi:hypothetical protein